MCVYKIASLRNSALTIDAALWRWGTTSLADSIVTETAQILADALGAEVVADVRWREISFGGMRG
ncbi:MAG: hypothetical protein EOO27_35885, partial [Comamonadaceae bacterium]